MIEDSFLIRNTLVDKYTEPNFPQERGNSAQFLRKKSNPVFTELLLHDSSYSCSAWLFDLALFWP